MPYNDQEEAQITSPLKFYEYLASGTPFVASRVPAVQHFEKNKDLAIEWADICKYDSFVHAFRRLVTQCPEGSLFKSEENRKRAAENTWEIRQDKLLQLAGLRERTVDDFDCTAFESGLGVL